MLDKSLLFAFAVMWLGFGGVVVADDARASNDTDDAVSPAVEVLAAPGPTVAERTRFVHGVLVVRRHGNWFNGYGNFTTDREAYPWLAFTAVSLRLLDRLDERAQRAHEAAQVAATEGEIGHTHAWREDGRRGHVVATREGTSTAGRRCRDFTHVITVGEVEEQARAFACQDAEGVWEVVATSAVPAVEMAP